MTAAVQILGHARVTCTNAVFAPVPGPAYALSNTAAWRLRLCGALIWLIH